MPASLLPPDEVPDAEFPLVLTTGRLLEHWHTGAMTRRSGLLDRLEPEGLAALNRPKSGGWGSNRRVDRGGNPARHHPRPAGQIVMLRKAWCLCLRLCEAAANRLTNPALDPFGKIPEFKFAAARVRGV